ncbi:hypothetical protein ACLKA7_007090 [Drosophila subpalustris]
MLTLRGWGWSNLINVAAKTLPEHASLEQGLNEPRYTRYRSTTGNSDRNTTTMKKPQNKSTWREKKNLAINTENVTGQRATGNRQSLSRHSFSTPPETQSRGRPQN